MEHFSTRIFKIMPAQSPVFGQQIAGIRDSTDVAALSPPKPLEIPRAARDTRYFAELIASVFPPAPGAGSRVVAFTSATRGAGVSFVSTSVAREVAETCEGKVLLAQAETLECLAGASMDVIRNSISSRFGRLWTINCEDRSYAEARNQSIPPERSFASVLDIVKAEFQNVILDVPSLGSSDSALRYASTVDSVVMVVEAGKTSKHALSVACRRIAVANGTVSGIVCNKRKYPIPHWLYRYL